MANKKTAPKKTAAKKVAKEVTNKNAFLLLVLAAFIIIAVTLIGL